MYRIILPVALLALASCKTTEKDQQAAPAQSTTKPATVEPAKPAPRPEPELDPKDLRWGNHAIDELGMNVPILAGIEVKTGEMGGNQYVRQTKKPLMTAVWYGYGRTLESWRSGYAGNTGATFGEEQSVTICGTPATRQELSLAASRVGIGRPRAMQLNNGMAGPGAGSTRAELTPAPAPTERAFRENPARTQVAIGMTVKKTPVVVTWTIETDKRAAFAASEKHYFESLCPG